MTTTEKRFWNKIARSEARESHEREFHVRRRIDTLDVGGGREVLVYFDNNPYADAPDCRPKAIERFKMSLRDIGVGTLAEAYYPPKCEEDAGYTYVLIIDAPGYRHVNVKAHAESAIAETEAEYFPREVGR